MFDTLNANQKNTLVDYLIMDIQNYYIPDMDGPRTEQDNDNLLELIQEPSCQELVCELLGVSDFSEWVKHQKDELQEST